MIRDPALRFWVDYVEAEGGLCEHDTETAQLVLPAELQRMHKLPEALTATSDPDVAHDEGAVLFAVGHPALDAAAARVLAHGDVGRAFFAWPYAPPPVRTTLLDRARATIAIDHGRIDPSHDPVPVYYPLLRVGVLVTYTLDDLFQEREEVWIDGSTAQVVPKAVERSLRSQAILSQSENGAVLRSADLARAVAAAHAALDSRASIRSAELERQAQSDLGDEQKRAQEYYDAVLATLEQRRSGALPERRELLDAQAEATQFERARRLREIAAKFESSRTIAPYRLNLLYVPALAFAVEVRRGERRYPLLLHWLLAPACFAPLRCPTCDAAELLVAGRSQLGCRRCLASS
jgi:hypothetical protein